MIDSTFDKAAGVPRIFLDTNILLDYLYFRGKEALAAEYIINVCLRNTIDCYVAAHSLPNIFYIIRKDFSAAARKQIIQNFNAIFHVQGILPDTIDRAIRGSYSEDLEDALQIQCAVDCGADYILTRDTEGFVNSPVKVLAPHVLIKELGL